MKNKILFMLLSVLLPMMAMAQRITDDEAANIASQVLGKQVVKAEIKKPAKAPSVNGEQQAEPFYSIFTAEDNKGFVIVSTDRRAPKIIGYGEGKADANNLPPQLKAILEKQDSVLQTTPNLPEHSSWRKSAPTRAESEEGKLMKTANWGQGYPYNLMTPEIDGQHCVTGCVATAMAIIMKYHGWPEKGRGEHSYNWNGQDLSFDYANTTFDWSQMPEEYEEGNFTEAQAQEVSKLMRAAGNSVQMLYGLEESAALSASIPYNLYRYFKFHLPKCNYNDNLENEEWSETLISEINSSCPVLYTSTNGVAAHAYIIDGYDIQNNFHINWGWAGNLNGYFALSDLLGYDKDHAMLYNIRRDEKATQEYEKIFIDDGSSTFSSIKFAGLNLNSYYENSYYGFYSVAFDPHDFGADYFDTRIVLTDENKNIKSVIEDEHPRLWTIGECPNNVPFIIPHIETYFSIGENIEIKPTDKFCVAYRINDEDEWSVLKSLGDVHDFVPVIGNEPKTVKFTVNNPDNAELFLPKSELMIGDDKIMYGQSTVEISAKSNEGSAIIYVNGEKRSFIADKNLGASVYFDTFDDINIDVQVIKYSEMSNLDLNIETPGTLASILSLDEAHKLQKVSIRGNINAEDIYYFRDNCWIIESIDLSEATILPNNHLPDNSFSNCGLLTNLKLPNNLKGLDSFAINGMDGIPYIIIPSSVTEFADFSFNSNKMFMEIVVESKVPAEISSRVFSGMWLKDDGILWVPKGSKDAYSNAENWKDFNYIEEYEGEYVKPEQIIVEPSNLNLAVGETYKLSYKVLPENATYTEKRIACNIYETGSPGTDGLTFDDWNLTAHRTGVYGAYSVLVGLMGAQGDICIVNVIPATIDVEEVSLDKTELSLTLGATEQLTATVVPEDATDKTVIWTSSDESVATVSAEGLVTAINIGTAVITATCGEASATCTVTVTPDSYTITYLIDGEVYHTETVKIGEIITPIAEPEKEGHTFSGWSKIPETMPAHDVTVTGIFTVNKYMVRYYDGETLLAEFEVEFGAEIPQYEYNNEEYIFEGWEGETYETMPAHDIAYYAITSSDIKALFIDDNVEVTVYDIKGTVVYEGKKAGMPKDLKGIYVVRYGDKTAKCRL